jgi:hypothetical protein
MIARSSICLFRNATATSRVRCDDASQTFAEMKANSRNRVSPHVETYDGSRPALLLISTDGLKEKRFSPERKMNKWRSALEASKISRLRPESHGSQRYRDAQPARSNGPSELLRAGQRRARQI